MKQEEIQRGAECDGVNPRVSGWRAFAYAAASAVVVLLPIARILAKKVHDWFLVDLAAYCAVSRALFDGNNPFPDRMEFVNFLLKVDPSRTDVPIVYPGQMLLFAWPSYFYGNAFQAIYVLVNIFLVLFVTALTLRKACGYSWRDIALPGKRQLVYAVCCFCFLSSACAMQTMRLGQITVILVFLFYGIFWFPKSAVCRTVSFAVIAVTKYSLLPVVAPLLFFKRHKLFCITAFALFVVLSISPMFFGNSLVEVYSGYAQAVRNIIQPGTVNHYSVNCNCCHLAFFRSDVLNAVMKGLVVCAIAWLLFRERKTTGISDTLMLLAFSLTFLVSYHGHHDYTLVFPLFFIRLFAFAKERKWALFCGTAVFPAYFLVPSRIVEKVGSKIGAIPGLDSIFWLAPSWDRQIPHIFPINGFLTVALFFWSLYLYFHVEKPYVFDIPSRHADRDPDR